MKLPVIALLTFSSAALAQTKTTRPARPVRPATVSGRVFAITKSGDLKPARIASVYLLLWLPQKGEKVEGDTAYFEWVLEFTNAGQVERGRQQADHTKWGSEEDMDRYRCIRTLRYTREALQRTLAWAEAHHKMSQVLIAEADEEGNFEFIVPRPGEYYILASGQAGFNDAFWGGLTNNEIDIEAGLAYTVKLSSPETACLVTE
jgi:hypothetical protein